MHAKNDKAAMITGASGGIGLEMARLSAERGYDLVLTGRRAEALHAHKLAIEAANAVTVTPIAMDLTEPGAAFALAQEVAGRGITVDLLVNNAGFGASGPFASMDRRVMLDMIAVNMTALTDLSHALLPGMIERGRGRVLNIASTAAFRPGPFMAVHHATKAYVLSLSEALSEETQGTGVTVTALCPGPIGAGSQGRADVADNRLSGRGANVMSPLDVARAGLDAVESGRRVCVPGRGNRLGALLARVIPHGLSNRFLARLRSS